MQLHFNRERVEQLLAHSLAAPAHTPLYDMEETRKPGLWLVGDEGIYLVSNGTPPLLVAGTASTRIVAPARECDPKALPFDEWWAVKGASFGSDDGCDFLDAAEIRDALASYRPGEDLILDVSGDAISLVFYPPPKRARGKRRA